MLITAETVYYIVFDLSFNNNCKYVLNNQQIKRYIIFILFICPKHGLLFWVLLISWTNLLHLHRLSLKFNVYEETCQKKLVSHGQVSSQMVRDLYSGSQSRNINQIHFCYTSRTKRNMPLIFLCIFLCKVYLRKLFNKIHFWYFFKVSWNSTISSIFAHVDKNFN